MNIKNLLVLLCGIWALALGLRVCTSLYSDAGVHTLYYSSANPLFMYWDFGPLFLLGLFTVVVSFRDYYRNLRNIHLGGVMRDEL